MIKIKDYIFNENEILAIHKDKMNGGIDFEYGNDKFKTFPDATFDDIEWNYPSKEIEYLYKRNQELEEENIKLKEQNQFLCEEQRKIRINSLNSCEWKSTEKEKNKILHKNIEHLQQRINKALKTLKECNVDIDSVRLCESIEYAIYQLEGKNNETN